MFAIAITLLALEIRLPDLPANVSDVQLGAELAKLTPKYISFLISFLAIGAYWVGHHHRFEYINRYDQRLIWINLLALACVAFLPFPTGLVGDHPNLVLAVQIYAGTMVAAGFAVYLTWWYAAQHHRLVDPDLPARVIRRRHVRALIAPLVFLVSMGLATLFGATVAEQSWWSLLIIYLVFVRY